MQVLARRALTLVWGVQGAVDGEFANKSAASAASLDSVKFQAVIKSAASAASPKAKSREGSSREVQDDGFGWRATASGHLSLIHI